jgi:hypothetical protein
MQYLAMAGMGECLLKISEGLDFFACEDYIVV